MYGLPQLSIPAISNKQTYKLLEEDSRRIWNNEEFEEYVRSGQLEPFIAEHMKEEYDDFSQIKVVLPQTVYDEEYVMDLGNVTVIAMKVENPHSSDGSIVYIPEEGVVFMGDCFCDELKGDTWQSHPEKMAALAGIMKDLDFDMVFHAHFDPMTREQFLEEAEQKSIKQ